MRASPSGGRVPRTMFDVDTAARVKSGTSKGTYTEPLRPSALLVASSVVLAGGCGSSAREQPTVKPAPRIPAAVAQQLAFDADAVASAQGCAARAPAKQFLDDVIAASPRIPARYQEQLTSAANDLYARIPACPPPQRNAKGEKPKHGKGDKPRHGHGHGHKKHGGHDD